MSRILDAQYKSFYEVFAHVLFHDINRKLKPNFSSPFKKKTRNQHKFRYSRTHKHFSRLLTPRLTFRRKEIGERKQEGKGGPDEFFWSRDVAVAGVIDVSRTSLGNPGSHGSSRTADDTSGRVSEVRASEMEKASGLLRARRGKFTGKISGKSRRGRQRREPATRARDRASSPSLYHSLSPHYRRYHRRRPRSRLLRSIRVQTLPSSWFSRLARYTRSDSNLVWWWWWW